MNTQPEDAKPIGLVIEDNPDQNLVFTMALNKAGFSTESIYNGTDAQRRLKETVPQIVILDLHLPDIDGNIILAQIRSDKRLSKVNVVLATADAVFADALQAEAELVLLKPVSFSQLSDLASRFNPKRETGSLRRK
ncbi:MAG TPA: response regulator [Anaerolineales bacterium]|nr:response regulator [Anaerolineales bacterium]